MESLVLYRKAILLASAKNQLNSNSVRVADVYADLKAVQETRMERNKVIKLPSPKKR